MPTTKTPAKTTAPKAEQAPDEQTQQAPAEQPKPASDGRPQHASLVAALAAFQAEVPTVRKGNTADVKSNNGGRSYTYDYADLSDVTERAMPLLGRHGLSFTARPTLHEGSFVLLYELRHESGDCDGGIYPLPNPNTPAQQMGSAITYARRYVLTSVTGIAPGGDDDDAGAIQQHTYQQQQPARQQQQRQAPRPAQQPPAQQQQPAQAEAVDWVARAEAAVSPTDLANTWQAARAAGAANDVLDGIANVGRRRQAEAQKQLAVDAQEAATEPPADPDEDEAAAVAAHEADLAAQAEAVQA